MRRKSTKTIFETAEFDRWGCKLVAQGLLPIEKRLIGYLSLDSRILELGCAGGRILRALKEQGFNNLIGLDYVFGFALLAKELVPNIVNADAVRIPIMTNFMDAVIALQQVICFVEDRPRRERFLAECYRVLKPGGYLLVSALNFENSSFWHQLSYRLLKFLRVLPGYEVKEDGLLPFLRKGGKPNFHFLFPDEPLLYWYRPDELRGDIEQAGFEILEFRAANPIFCVAEKPQK